MSKRTPKNHKIHTTLLLFYVNTRKKIKSNKRQWISFRPQRWDVPYRKPSCLWWEALVCGKLILEPAPNGTKFIPWHVDAAPWYHAKFHEFQTCFGFTRILKPSFPMFSAEPRCPDVWISLPFLAWDLEIHLRTHMLFFNQFVCTGACVCSSNLNYAHKCIENPVNA